MKKEKKSENRQDLMITLVTNTPNSIILALESYLACGGSDFLHNYAPLPLPPLKKGADCFATVRRSVYRYVGRSVCRSVGLSVCRPSVVCSISIVPFTWSIQNLVQGLRPISRWSLLIFRAHVQRSRSNHSFGPSVLSTQYLLTPPLDQYQTWYNGCP